MLDVTVKTLDGKNRTFCVPDDITVKDFKVKIANSIEIAADSQRLIFQGRVLQDEKKLNDYDVNGSVLHVVQRAPPSARGGASSSTGSSTTHPPGYMQGSFSVNHEMHEAGQNVVEQVLSGMGEMGRNAQVSARSSVDGSAVEVHINLSSIAPPQVQSGSQLRINQARQMVKKANKTLHRLENPSESAENSGRHSPMEAETTSDEATNSEEAASSTEGATANPPAAENSADDSPGNAQPPGTDGSTDQAQNRGPRHPTSDVLSDLLQQVMELNSRLEPHLERYHRITSEDLNYEGDDDARRDAQRVQNLVSQVLHYISHIYHHISDLMIDMNTPPPRQVRAPPTSIVQQAPADITISPHVIRRNNGTSQPQGSRTSSSSTSSTNSSSTTRSTSTSTNTTPSSQAGPLPFGNMQLPTGVHIQAIPVPTNIGNSGMPNAGNLPPGPGGVTAHSGPFVFMEQFGPSSVTLNSIQVSATAVPEQTPTSTSATNPGGAGQARVPGPAGGIPLNIAGLPPFLQMLQGRRPPGPGMTTSSTSTTSSATSTSSSSASSSTSTSTTNSTSSGTGAGQGVNGAPGQPPMGFMIPGPLPPGALPGIPAGMPAGFMAIPSLPGADPFLPCQSRHLIGQRAQARANQPGEAGQADSLGGMVNEIVQGIMRQQNPHLQPGQGPNTTGQPTGTAGPNPPNPFANLFSNITGAATGSARPGQPRQGSAQGAEPSFMAQFRNILQQGNQQTAPRNTTSTSTTTSTNTTSTSNSSSNANQQSEMSDEVFAQLVSGISGYVAQAALGQQPTDTISDFLTNLGQSYNIPQGEGLMTDIFNCIARTLTFADFMAVFYGRTHSLGRLRAPLRELITTQVLENQPMNEENLNGAVGRIIQDMQSDIDSACADVEARDDIDYKATVNAFLRHHLKVLIEMVMNSTDSDTEFGARLYSTCRSAIHQFAALSRHCLRDGEQSVSRLVEGRVRHISRDVNPVIQQWMVGISSQETRSLLASVSVPTSNYEQFIVRRTSMETTSPGGESSDNSYMSADEAPSSKVKEVPACNGHAEEAMDVDSASGSGRVAAAAVPEVDLSPGGVGIPPEVMERLPPPPVADPADDTSVGVGSNSWHAQVPSDWVPIITRDGNRQRRQAPSQGPYSDGYLNGMSAKRRRIVGHQKAEQGCAMGDLKLVVPEAIKKAAQTAGVTPITSHEEISRDAAANNSLCSALKEQICDSVQQRLEKDPDYVPEKYPKADKFFGKK